MQVNILILKYHFRSDMTSISNVPWKYLTFLSQKWPHSSRFEQRPTLLIKMAFFRPIFQVKRQHWVLTGKGIIRDFLHIIKIQFHLLICSLKSFFHADASAMALRFYHFLKRPVSMRMKYENFSCALYYYLCAVGH